MKRICTFMGAMMLAIAGFAQVTGSLSPAGGNFYPDDAMHQNKIAAEYTGSIVATNAVVTITANGTPQTVTIEDVIETAFSIPVPVMANNTPFTVAVSGVTNDTGTAVANLSGSYTYKTQFPLTNVSPATGDTLASKTTTVVFNFNQNITYTSIIITSGSVTTTLAGSTTGTNTVSVPLLANYWGIPLGGYNNITIALKGVEDANGNPISNSSGSIGTILSYYPLVDSSSAVTFLGVDPDPLDIYAEDVLDWDVIFKYSDAVVMTNTTATAVITYYDENDDALVPPVNVASADINAGFNPREGYYGLFVYVPTLAPASLPDLSYLTVKLQGLTYNSAAVPAQTVRYDVAPVVFRTPATRGENEGKLKGIQSEKAEINKMVNIYSVQGILIKKNVPASTVHTLDKGLYIVGNKKVLVK